MVKIFIGNTAVYLLERKDDQLKEIPLDNTLTVDFTDKKALQALMDKIEHGINEKAVKIYHTNANELFEAFKSLYNTILAAGGVVKNSKQEVLMIYRKNKWDLPKGKIEKDESKEDAGVREVMEETGMKELQLQDQIFIYPWKQPCTYHTYWEGRKKMLKHTYWFHMASADQTVFDPQFEEGITKAEWVSPTEFPKLMKKSYGSINDVLGEIK